MSDAPAPTSPGHADDSPPRRVDSFMFGCLLGGLITIAFAILMVFIGLSVSKSLMLSEYWFVSWGVTQWIGIVPMIMAERSKGHPKGVAGLIVAGCVGTLVSTACAGWLTR